MNTVDGALSLGIGGGSFAASHALVHETARQRVENPDKTVNIRDALKENTTNVKNIDMGPRQSHGEIETSGLKVRALDDSGAAKFGFKKRK